MAKKILIADYDEDNVSFLVELLHQKGYTVITAVDGIEALDHFSLESPELVLLSAMLPKLHGFHVCKTMKRMDQKEETPVLIMSNIYKSSFYKYQAIKEYMADDFLLKPLDEKLLLQRIQYFLTQKNKKKHEQDTLQIKNISVLEKRLKSSREKETGFEDMLEKTLASLMDLDQSSAPQKKEDNNRHDVLLPSNLEDTLVDLMVEKETKKTGQQDPLYEREAQTTTRTPPKQNDNLTHAQLKTKHIDSPDQTVVLHKTRSKEKKPPPRNDVASPKHEVPDSSVVVKSRQNMLSDIKEDEIDRIVDEAIFLDEIEDSSSNDSALQSVETAPGGTIEDTEEQDTSDTMPGSLFEEFDDQTTSLEQNGAQQSDGLSDDDLFLTTPLQKNQQNASSLSDDLLAMIMATDLGDDPRDDEKTAPAETELSKDPFSEFAETPPEHAQYPDYEFRAGPEVTDGLSSSADDDLIPLPDNPPVSPESDRSVDRTPVPLIAEMGGETDQIQDIGPASIDQGPDHSTDIMAVQGSPDPILSAITDSLPHDLIVPGTVEKTPALPSSGSPDEPRGTTFGKYMILEKIAVGGMAEIFKAKQRGVEGFEKLVAIKRILPHLSDNQDFVSMFIDEGKIAAKLTHQNIAQIYELGEEQGYYYIAMEYVHGKDLKTLMATATQKNILPSLEHSALIIAKLCNGLDYAHRQKDFEGRNLQIVHRDISPQNVLISYEGEVKIIDFGIAKAAAKDHHTRVGALKGKILYMSPEQAWGKNIDKRSDIFSLGTLLYEMITNNRLFLAASEIQILQKVREAHIIPPSQINDKIPANLEQIVLKALAKDVDDRYQSAGDMQRDIESFLYSRETKRSDYDLSNYMYKLFLEENETRIKDLDDRKYYDQKTDLKPAEHIPAEDDEDTVATAQEKPRPQQTDLYADDEWLDAEIKRLLNEDEPLATKMSLAKKPLLYLAIFTVIVLIVYFFL